MKTSIFRPEFDRAYWRKLRRDSATTDSSPAARTRRIQYGRNGLR